MACRHTARRAEPGFTARPLLHSPASTVSSLGLSLLRHHEKGTETTVMHLKNHLSLHSL